MHQPRQLTHFSFFDIDNCKQRLYFEDQIAEQGRSWINSVANLSYSPLNQIFAEIMEDLPDFKFSLAISGITLDLLEEHAGETLRELQTLVQSNRVEMVNDSYYHSLSWFYSKNEFAAQIIEHRKKIWQLFHQRPSTFAAINKYFSIEMAEFIHALGFKTMLVPSEISTEPIRFLTANVAEELLELIAKYKFDDSLDTDLLLQIDSCESCQFKIRDFTGLALEEFVDNVMKNEHELVNLFFEVEDFGLKNHEDTGIFEFIRFLPEELSKRGMKFVTPKDVRKRHLPQALPVTDIASLTKEDYEKGFINKMQQSALNRIYLDMEKLLNQAVQTQKREAVKVQLLSIWRGLQSLDHINFMSTDNWSEQQSPYESPYDAYINYMNVVNDFSLALKKMLKK